MYIVMNYSELLLYVCQLCQLSIFGLASFIVSVSFHDFLHQYVLVLSVVLPKTISGPESFIAEIAGDDDSVQVVCFNVVFYVLAHAFFSTNFALISWLKSIRIFVLAFLHH